LFKKYPNKYFVETGSYLGLGITRALEAGFEKVLSIELGDKYYGICKEAFKDNPKVQLFKGDSGLLLGSMIKDITEPITFWLDGHFSGDDTALGVAPSPICLELAMIKEHPIKTHTIIIDDMHCMAGHHKDIFKLLKEINPNYKLERLPSQYDKEAILVATPTGDKK